MVVGFADLLNEDVLNRPALFNGQIEREEVRTSVSGGVNSASSNSSPCKTLTLRTGQMAGSEG